MELSIKTKKWYNMSKKYEKKIQALKDRKEEHKHDKKKHTPVLNGSNIKKKSVQKQKKALQDLKKKVEKSKKIW